MTGVRWRPRSLFGSTALTLGVALLLFQALTLGIISWNLTYPMARNAADDLAALIVLSARTWVELPPQTRPAFERELMTQHGLSLRIAAEPLPDTRSYLPYRYLLESALTRRAGVAVSIRSTRAPEWYWTEIPAGGTRLQVGFPRERIGIQPPAAVLMLLTTVIILTLGTTLVLARRLTRPLARLARAAAQVGAGATPEPVPERGPEELAQLARRFNAMARDVRELLANRTVLLAGISHDLRTPLQRMDLAVEMLPPDTDRQLVGFLRRDIGEMNRLISEFLELGGGLQGRHETTDVHALLAAVVADARRGGAVTLDGSGPCLRDINAQALRRIVGNLVANALRYGAGKPVDIKLDCGPDTVLIHVLDRGPGIPPQAVEAVFQPFYRLEPSRSTTTGGSGLGLAVVRQLAHANNWRVDLHPRPGGGTDARITLAPGPV